MTGDPVSSPREIRILFVFMAALAWIISDNMRWQGKVAVWAIMMFPVMDAIATLRAHRRYQARINAPNIHPPTRDPNSHPEPPAPPIAASLAPVLRVGMAADLRVPDATRSDAKAPEHPRRPESV